MTDQVNTVQSGTQGVATQQVQPSAPTASQGAAQENAQETPQVVTREELSQLLAKRDEEFLERLKQSDRDRAKRIEGEIGSLKDILSKADIKLAPEQESKMRAEIGARIDGTPEEAQTPAGPASPAQAADQFIAQFIGEVFKKAGTPVTRSDPEWAELQATIDKTYNDPLGHIEVTQAAYAASKLKAQRLAANSENADARVVGSGGGQPSSVYVDKPASKLWEEAFRDK